MTQDSVAQAELRIRRALNHIQNAQTQLGYASAELSGVIGVLRDWKRLGKLYDQIHKEWYKLEARRQRGNFDLDGISKAVVKLVVHDGEKR